MTIPDRIRELTREHGGMRAAAAAVGLPAYYLTRLAAGESRPTTDALKRLGLRRVTHYERC